MRHSNKDDRVRQIKEGMVEGSRPDRNRRSTDQPGVHMWGDKHIYATNVIYQFGAPLGRKVMNEQSFTGVDWATAPKLARWWAVDADGQAHWFCLPNVAAFTAFWYSEPLQAPNFGFNGDWRESLVERPRT